MLRRSRALAAVLAVAFVAGGAAAAPAAAEVATSGDLARVERIGRRLLSATPDAPSVQFQIIENDSVNAGATWGSVAVTTGLLRFVRDDDELAAVLGHEIAHLTEGHVTRGFFGGLAITALAIVVESQAPGFGNAAGTVGQVFYNRFSQSQEFEADEEGIRIAWRAGYDPAAAARVQRRFAEDVPETRTASLFSSHPSSVERTVRAERIAASFPAREPRPDAGIATRPTAPLRERRPEAPVRAYARDDGGPTACDKARVYRRMAENARSSGERNRLLDRARRFCPERN